ncbi:MAG: alpha/beta hydrolase, partial [Micrococcales bacterium]|nr:alpha/beta hydrolase [Micrococcales bacterium]
MRQNQPRGGRFIALSMLAIANLLLAACMPGVLLEPATTSPTVKPTPPPSGDLFDQVVNWEQCDEVTSGAECATILAPLDWDQPEGDTIVLALARLAATSPDQRVGSLLFNPGGPGASAVDMLDYMRGQVGAPVKEVFDLVAFDPRGVGASTAVVCYPTTEELDDFFAASWPPTREGFEESAEVAQSFAQACQDNTGPVLAHVDTNSAANDMNLIRAVLGDEKLNYLGFSYGTELGATFADLFPDKVGRLVLDGAVDPSLPASAHDLAQARGFQQALEAYVDDCLADTACPLDGPKSNALGQIHNLL